MATPSSEKKTNTTADKAPPGIKLKPKPKARKEIHKPEKEEKPAIDGQTKPPPVGAVPPPKPSRLNNAGKDVEVEPPGIKPQKEAPPRPADIKPGFIGKGPLPPPPRNEDEKTKLLNDGKAGTGNNIDEKGKEDIAEDEDEYHIYTGLDNIEAPKPAKPKKKLWPEEKGGSLKRPPCWGWALFACNCLLFLFILGIIIFLVMNYKSMGSSSSGQEAHIQPSSSPSQTAIQAKFLMWCSGPPGYRNYDVIDDHCWLNDNTLVIAQNDGEHVWSLTVDVTSKTCTSKVIDSGYKVKRISCSPEGILYVVDHFRQRVIVFNPGGSKQTWRPAQRPTNIASNKDYILVGDETGPVYVYDKKGQFQYKINIDRNKYELFDTDLSKTGLFIASTVSKGDHVVIYSLSSESSVLIGGFGTGDGLFDGPSGLTSTASGKVVVCDRNNDRLSVFNEAGLFLFHIQYLANKGEVRKPWTVSLRARAGKPSLMAVGDLTKNVKFYSIDI